MANFQNLIGYKLGVGAITAAYTTIYTVPTASTIPAVPATRTFVKDINICNTTAGALGVYVHLVPSGGTADTTNALYYNTSVAANSSIRWNGVQIMNAGDTIQVKGSATGLAIIISGAQGT
jgi:hypothetical protein